MSDTDKKVWFITGAGRGMGVDIAKATAAAGNGVVATGRNTVFRISNGKIVEHWGHSDDPAGYLRQPEGS